MKVKIKKYTAVAAWRWENSTSDDMCGICRVQFDGTCPNCRFPGDDCPLLNGRCGHAFHLHCVNDWIQTESSRGLCPMCRQKFEFNSGP
ncbi:RING/U-box [Ascodesmis nigricans]|uniref:Anaphase-promoting complex subunit 11 n=1 Tax=Ascodesmis nigricans TaxID=341454 RepID=A0A4S2N438_9PEZI|nr:RING/U-box [Ascodesmis nigricans]